VAGGSGGEVRQLEEGKKGKVRARLSGGEHGRGWCSARTGKIAQARQRCGWTRRWGGGGLAREGRKWEGREKGGVDIGRHMMSEEGGPPVRCQHPDNTDGTAVA
jgi:hypothetical protein